VLTEHIVPERAFARLADIKGWYEMSRHTLAINITADVAAVTRNNKAWTYGREPERN
jgi:hypothetical protein